MASESIVKDSLVNKENISKALKQIEMIQAGKLPKKSARDFLKESRNNNK